MIIKFGKIFILIIILLFCLENFAQEKRGLLIAISKYKDKNWREIHSTNDIPLIKKILLSQGFKENNIKVLQDTNATKKDIIGSLENLYNMSNKGDIIVIHFSGHGQRIYDDNGDESDFADEALIPYDAYQEWSEIYKGENHLIDDEIGQYLIKLREKIGANGNVVLFIDACYSGTIARNSDYYRGIDDVFAPPEVKNRIKNIISNPNESTGIYKSCVISFEDEKDNLAKLIIFTSSRNNERSKEIFDGKQFYGSLSYALSIAFSEIKGNETYKDIYERIYSYMKFNARLMQTPLIEGEINNIVFSYNLLPTSPYFKIVEKNLYGEYIVNGGYITGLTDSTILGIFEEEIRNPELSVPITKGMVYNSENFQALIKIEDITRLNESDLGKYRLYILKQGIVLKKLYIGIDDISEDMKSLLIKELQNSKFLMYSENDPDYIISNINLDNKRVIDSIYIYKAGNQLKLQTVIFTNAEDFTEKVISKFKEFLLRDLLLDFQMKSEHYNIEVIINNLTRGTNSSSLIQEAGLYDTIKLSIKNIGDRAGYITLINFQPDNLIKQFIPKRNENYSQYYIEPGNVIEKKFINSKIGEDIYKIFLTKDYIDFTYILDSKVAKRAGDLTELESFFIDVNQEFVPRGNLSIIGTTKQVLINVNAGN